MFNREEEAVNMYADEAEKAARFKLNSPKEKVFSVEKV